MASRGPERIGSYRLIKLLGKGHFCDLWEVERAGDGQRWAMKLLPAGSGHTRERVSYLRHEFTVGRNLNHPNVIETKEYVSGADGSYVILELFPSTNLKQLIRQGVEPMTDIVENIVRGAATGLAYFHEQGWIHRDIKPDNYLVGEGGEVKLIDFNLAQRRKGALARLLPARAKVQGTQSYMSPEQIRGQHVDERSDIYSFGCMIYELVNGKPPFTGTSTNDLLNKHLRSRAPSLTASGPHVNPAFARLVDKMIIKEPKGRPASMQEVLAGLQEASVFRKPPAR